MTARDAEDRLRPAEAAGRLLALVPSADVPPAGPELPAAVAREVGATRPLDLPTTLQRDVTPDVPATTPTPQDERAAHSRRSRTSRRWPLVVSGVLVALLTAAAVLFVVPHTEPAPEPPEYPAVDGQLGDHLEQLQESVDP
ncbi:hypothetical protein E3O42_12940 [Cryobacterium adonitolivorans]|uniref:Uncharacterized protein n=1 Tax=Cryobacterium adonitolivorans TaxID=1259189 RepID=A0A4R8W321_9MICO|nr:hypothetical protein [Cryobacterium adonitolivorans]TFB99793.1 hypothetical protein E3O42_12940 [Cryobacterium adonitolivorans]